MHAICTFAKQIHTLYSRVQLSQLTCISHDADTKPQAKLLAPHKAITMVPLRLYYGKLQAIVMTVSVIVVLNKLTTQNSAVHVGISRALHLIETKAGWHASRDITLHNLNRVCYN